MKEVWVRAKKGIKLEEKIKKKIGGGESICAPRAKEGMHQMSNKVMCDRAIAYIKICNKKYFYRDSLVK